MVRTIETPKTMKDGLLNFIQFAINYLENEDPQEANYILTDLQGDLYDGCYSVTHEDYPVNGAIIRNVELALEEQDVQKKLEKLETVRAYIEDEKVSVRIPTPGTFQVDASGVNKR